MRLLLIALPKDREIAGWGHLFDADGKIAHSFPARGKADSQKASAKGNQDRFTRHPFGDTPSGRYAVTRIVAVGDPELAKTTRLGSHWIPLTGSDGDAFNAWRLGRTGLGIHGGRGEDLVVTYGCVRVRDSDMTKLRDLIGGEEVLPIIEDI